MQTFYLQLYNPGLLPTEFTMKFPTDRELEPEPWADEGMCVLALSMSCFAAAKYVVDCAHTTVTGTPTTEQLMYTAIVDELACFDVHPRAGTIAPRGSLTITISYKYSSLKFAGLHRLPILFKVTHGKQVWIDLAGHTLAPSAAMLFLPDAGDVELRAVSVGLPPEEAPAQSIRLWNVGDVDVPYDVDIVDSTAPSHLVLEQPNALSLITEEGTAAANTPLEIVVAFRPVAPMRYAFRLRVTYRGTGKRAALAH